MFQIKIPYGQVSTERKKTKLNLFCNFIRIDLPLGYISQREERLKEKIVKYPNSKSFRICLKENFHREKKDEEKCF
jgi:hypothetical protein